MVLLVGVLATAALAAPAAGGGEPDLAGQVDYRVDPLTAEQAQLRATAMEAVLNGKAHGKTHEVARGQYVELEREGEDPDGPCSANSPTSRTTASRSRIVTTTTRRSGRRLQPGLLHGHAVCRGLWRQLDAQLLHRAVVQPLHGQRRCDRLGPLPGNACDYDDGDPGPGSAHGVWQFLIDSIDGWYDAQIAAGKTPAEIDDYLSQFDVWDRYDWDGDGNFDEPDGYIDHMQFVHAGEGNEAGGGALGDCAIWSHSWFAYYNLVGVEGPSPEFLIGGVQIGESSFWVNKYTIQPENGGVGVFAHEYGHDLGLPDLYDYTGENSTGFWTLMSSGSWLSQNDYDIGSAAEPLGRLGEVPARLAELRSGLSPATSPSTSSARPRPTPSRPRACSSCCPTKKSYRTDRRPVSGDYFYYSGSGNNLDNWMYKAFTLGAGSTLIRQGERANRNRLGLRLLGCFDRWRCHLGQR